MADLKIKLEQLWREIDSHQRKWENVIDLWGAAYETAYNRQLKNMPKQVPVDTTYKLALDALKWIAGGVVGIWFAPAAVAVIMMPVGYGIGKLGDIAGAAPPAHDITVPPVSETPGHFHKSLNFATRTVCIRFLDYINDLIRLLNEKGAVSVSESNLKKVYDEIELSPFWYVPANWDQWKESEIADEIEKGLWAKWAVRSKQFIMKSRNLDFSPTFKRMKELKVKPGGKDLDYSGSWMMGDPFRNIRIMEQLAKWGENYQPEKSFGGTLPPKVRAYLLKETVKMIAHDLKIRW